MRCSYTNRVWLEFSLLCAGLNCYGQAARAARAADLPLATPPVLQVVSLPTGASVQGSSPGLSSLNLGHVSWANGTSTFGVNHKKDRSSFSVSTSIGLHLDCSKADANRLASVSVFLQQSDSRYTVALDGMKLLSSPAVINATLPCGSTTPHSFEVEVPIKASEGPINTSVGFQVTLR